MARLRVIDDSDDDGDFSPAPSAEEIDAPAGGAESPVELHFTQSQRHGLDSLLKENSDSLRGDSGRENVGGDANPAEFAVRATGGAIPGAARGSGSLREVKAGNSSSSLTDPTRATQKERKRPSSKELAGLTQITTPGKETAKGAQDVWEFPGSPVEAAAEITGRREDGYTGKGRVVKTYSKRKRGNDSIHAKDALSSSPVRRSSKKGGNASSDRAESAAFDGEDGNASPMPSRKRRKDASQKSPARDFEGVDLVVIPTSEEAKESDKSVVESTTGTIIQDTLIDGSFPPFYIGQSHLTTSQKQDYLRVSCSSSLEKDARNLSLPQSQTRDQEIPTSEATISYPTPSRYNPSALPPAPSFGDHDSSSLKASSKNSGKLARREQPTSSPDELATQTPKQKKHKVRKEHPDGDAFSGDAMPGGENARLSGKRQRQQADAEERPQQDDEWDSDSIGYRREHYKPRQSRRRSGTDAAANFEEPSRTDKPSSPRRRVKESRQEESPENAEQDDAWDSDKIGYSRERYNPRPSQRKSKFTMDEDDEEPEPPTKSMPDTCPPDPPASAGAKGPDSSPVMSVQEGPPGTADQLEGIDPEVLAAIPEDIRQEAIEAHRSRRNSQTSRNRSSGRTHGVSDSIDRALPTENALQPKKRGRKKKVVESEKSARDSPVMEIVPNQDPVAPPKRKKRGRPKKYEAKKPVEIPIDLSTRASEEQHTTNISSKSGTTDPAPVMSIGEHDSAEAKEPSSKRIATEHELGNDEGSIVDEDLDTNKERKALQDISNISSPGKSRNSKTDEKRAVDNREEHAPHSPQANEETPDHERQTSKDATPARQQGKVPFRVGLSKRSRIAPLLKIIRK